jgi:S-formylglutathione hydrolase
MAAAAPSPPPVAALEQMSRTKMFGGHNLRFRHHSATLGCPMTFSVFLPPSPASDLPVLYWLSGLTCNDENFVTKAGAQRAAAAHGIALVAPDTSPRGLNIEGEADSWDFGVGKDLIYNIQLLCSSHSIPYNNMLHGLSLP